MKQLYYPLLILICFSFQANAQWYFEAGINDSKFTQYTNKGADRTGFDSYDGLRDMSYAVGYLFTFQKLEKRLAPDYKYPLLRLGAGVAFDQLSLKTNATSATGVVTPIDYDLSKVQGRLGLYFMPPIVRNREKIPTVELQLSALGAYNLYTHATQHQPNKTVDLINNHDQFGNTYLSYIFGAGLQFRVNPQTRIYAKYESDNSIGIDEKNTSSNVQEDYSVFKRRILIGLLVDFKRGSRLAKKRDDMVDKVVADLEQNTKNDSINIAELDQKVDAVENQLKDALDNTIPQLIETKIQEHELVKHKKGFEYLPHFKHVAFDYNSSYFDIETYRDKLKDLAVFLAQNPHLKVKLVGYADSKTGDNQYNLGLSQRRAKRVKDHLIRLGIDPYRLESIGAGETLQFSIDDLPENRRTEILILQ